MDILARVVAEHLGKFLNCNVIVENLKGNGGIVAATQYLGNRSVINANFVAVNMQSMGVSVSLRFTARVSESVNRVVLYVTTVSGTSPTYRITLRDDNGGIPAATWMGSTTTTLMTGWNHIDIGTTALTAGNIYHIVVENQTGNTNYASVMLGTLPPHGFVPLDQFNDPNADALQYNAGWVESNVMPVFLVRNTSGVHRGNPFNDVVEANIHNYDTAANPADDYVRSEYFVVPTGKDWTVNGVSVWGHAQATNMGCALRYTLLDPAGPTTLAEGILHSGTSAPTAPSWLPASFPAVTLGQGKAYRLVVHSPTCGTSTQWYTTQSYAEASSPFQELSFDGLVSYAQFSSAGVLGTTIDSLNRDLGFRFVEATAEPTATFTSTATVTPSVTATATLTPTITPNSNAWR